ncbi:MAG: tetratricopeptide repeat protein [Armatimonadota bacterium]
MKRPAFLITALFLCLVALPALAGEDESLASVVTFGRNGGLVSSGFAVGDGSYIVTSIDAAVESAPNGKILPVVRTVVVSNWTGDAYPAKIVATNEKARIALLKIAAPAVPPVPLANDKAFSRTSKATLGQLLSGEEVGTKFQTVIYGVKLDQKPVKLVVKSLKGANACFTEIRDINWLFLSKVDPSDKASKAALVSQPGVGALGVFIQRLVIGDGPRAPVFYQVYPAPELKSFLVKSGVPENTLSQSTFTVKKTEDSDNSFQAISLALYASAAGSIDTDDLAAAAIKLRPKSAMPYMLQGVAFASFGKYDAATKSINKAIELDQTLPDAFLNRGLVYAAAGKATEAEQDLRKAIESDPTDSRPLIALADVLVNKDNKLDEALTLAKKAVAVAPNDPSCRISLARVLKHKNDFDGAIAELRLVIDSAPNWDEPHVALAVTCEAAGKLDMAEAEYRKLVELMPTDPSSHIALIEFLISAGKKDDARAEIGKTRELTLTTGAADAVKKLESKLDESEKKD